MPGAFEGKSQCQSRTCGAVFDGLEPKCPECGHRAMPQAQIAKLGVVAIALGLFLIAFMGAITVWTLPMMHPNPEGLGNQRGDPAVMKAVTLSIYGLVASFGVIEAVIGFYMMTQGKRNWRLVRVLTTVVAALLGAIWLVRSGLLLR